MSTFTPIGDRILVEPDSAEKVTASGIILPNINNEKPLRGKVVAAGPGKKDELMQVKVDDTVIYGEFSGSEIIIDGKEFLIMRQGDVHGIID